MKEFGDSRNSRRREEKTAGDWFGFEGVNTSCKALCVGLQNLRGSKKPSLRKSEFGNRNAAWTKLSFALVICSLAGLKGKLADTKYIISCCSDEVSTTSEFRGAFDLVSLPR